MGWTGTALPAAGIPRFRRLRIVDTGGPRLRAKWAKRDDSSSRTQEAMNDRALSYEPTKEERVQGRIIMSTPKMTMMTREDIRTELGWTDDMIHSLLQTPDSTNARRCKDTGEYTYGLYKRERVLAVAQSTEGRAAKRRWDETLRGRHAQPQGGQHASAI